MDGRHPAAPQIPGPPSHASQADRGANRSATAETGENPAFIVELGPAALPADSEDNETSAGPGKSANSPAHRARSFIAQFQALNETQDSPFKSFGHIVSQLAQGRTFEEIFAPYSVQQEEDEGEDAASLSTDNAPALLETVVEGEEEDGALVVSGDPAPNLLETFLENEDEEGETVTTGS